VFDPPPTLARTVATALAEDLGGELNGTGWHDITTNLLIPREIHATGSIIFREEGVAAGLVVVPEVFQQLSMRTGVPQSEVRVDLLVREGARTAPGSVVAEISAPATLILTGERVCLNFIGLMSGIATLTRKFVEAVDGTGVKIFDTRKTTPMLRDMEKYAVRAGGGENHRHNLQDQVLIKDNHLAVLGGPRTISDSVARAIAADVGPVVVEAQNLAEVKAAAERGAHVIILDNAAPDALREASGYLREHFGENGKRPLLEASGGITLANVREAASSGVDRISIGALTHSARAIDVALDILLSSDTPSRE